MMFRGAVRLPGLAEMIPLPNGQHKRLIAPRRGLRGQLSSTDITRKTCCHFADE
jgi:hypothetical protein